ncbi:tape measure protein [Phage DSL-LC06]|nr:tape measure protein [Phage DSL-LC06]
MVVKVTLDANQAERALKSLSKSTDLFGRALKATAAFFGTRELVNYSNRWTDLNSRLKNATGSTDAANAALARIEATARRTYSSVEQTAETFLRNATVLNSLGVSTDNQIKLSEALNNALVVSGAKGERAASALNAMSRSLARGKLDTEAFTTLLATAPEIIDAVSRSTGKSVQELQKMASEGKLLNSVVVPALIGQLGLLETKAEQMPATIGDAFVMLDNALGSLIDKTNKQTNLTGKLAAGIIFLADNLKSAAVAAGTFLTVLAIGRIRAITAAFASMNAVLLANPLTLIATGIAVLATSLYNLLAPLKDVEISLGTKLIYAIETFANTAAGAFTSLVGGVAEFGTIVGETLQKVFTLQDPRAAFENFGQRMKTAFVNGYERGQVFNFISDDARNKINTALDEQKKKIEDVGNAASNTGKIINDVADDNKEKIDALTKSFKSLEESLDTDIGAAYRKYEENLTTINEAEKNNVKSSTGYNELRRRNEEQLNEALQNIVNKRVDEYEDAEKEKTKILEDEAKKRKELEQAGGALLEEIGGSQGTSVDILKQQEQEKADLLKKLKDEGVISEEEYLRRLDMLRKQYADKSVEREKNRVQRIIDEVANGTATIAELENLSSEERIKVATGTAGKMLGDMAQFSKTAFEANKALSIANALIKSKEAVVGAYSFGSAIGGPILGAVFAGAAVAATAAQIAAIKNTQYTGPRERGGPVGANQSYLVGEGGPEILRMGPNAGTIIPNNQIGNSPISVNFNITTVDAADFDTLLYSRRAVITNIINNALQKRGKEGVI